jgi:hypothetical protein
MTDPIRTHLIRFEDIDTAAQTQIRAELSEEIVSSYVSQMKAGEVFPPVVVFVNDPDKLGWFLVRNKAILADGFHRLEAAKRALSDDAEPHINCEIHAGDLRDAQIYACGSNARHGARLKPGDVRRAVIRLLDDEQWSSRSARAIASFVGCSNSTASKIRRELRGDEEATPITVTRSGREYEMSPAAQPEPAAPPAPPAHPEPSVCDCDEDACDCGEPSFDPPPPPSCDNCGEAVDEAGVCACALPPMFTEEHEGEALEPGEVRRAVPGPVVSDEGEAVAVVAEEPAEAHEQGAPICANRTDEPEGEAVARRLDEDKRREVEAHKAERAAAAAKFPAFEPIIAFEEHLAEAARYILRRLAYAYGARPFFLPHASDFDAKIPAARAGNGGGKPPFGGPEHAGEPVVMDLPEAIGGGLWGKGRRFYGAGAMLEKLSRREVYTAAGFRRAPVVLEFGMGRIRGAVIRQYLEADEQFNQVATEARRRDLEALGRDLRETVRDGLAASAEIGELPEDERAGAVDELIHEILAVLDELDSPVELALMRKGFVIRGAHPFGDLRVTMHLEAVAASWVDAARLLVTKARRMGL